MLSENTNKVLKKIAFYQKITKRVFESIKQLPNRLINFFDKKNIY